MLEHESPGNVLIKTQHHSFFDRCFLRKSGFKGNSNSLAEKNKEPVADLTVWRHLLVFMFQTENSNTVNLLTEANKRESRGW